MTRTAFGSKGPKGIRSGGKATAGSDSEDDY